MQQSLLAQLHSRTCDTHLEMWIYPIILFIYPNLWICFAHLSPKQTSNTEAKVSGRSLAPFVGMPPRNNKPPIHGQVVASSLSRRSVRKRSQDNNNIQRFSGFWVPIDSAWKSLTTRSPNLDISQKSPDINDAFGVRFFGRKKYLLGSVTSFYHELSINAGLTCGEKNIAYIHLRGISGKPQDLTEKVRHPSISYLAVTSAR